MILISKTVRALACSFALLGLHGVALSQVAKPVAEGLMRKSGLWEQLGAIAPQMEAAADTALSQSESKMSPDELKRLTQAFVTAYSPMHLRATALGVMAAQLTPAHVAALEAWYNSPDGKAITQLEEAASTDAGDFQARVQTGAKVLASATADRQALLKRVAQVTRAAQASTDIIINTAVGIQEGLAKVMPMGSKSAAKEFRAVLEQQRPQMVKSFKTATVALFAAAYEGLDDESLSRYVGFLKSPAGLAYTEVSLRAMDQAFVEAAHDLGRSIPAVKSNANL
jgi:hypothetical protein